MTASGEYAQYTLIQDDEEAISTLEIALDLATVRQIAGMFGIFDYMVQPIRPGVVGITADDDTLNAVADWMAGGVWWTSETYVDLDPADSIDSRQLREVCS